MDVMAKAQRVEPVQSFVAVGVISEGNLLARYPRGAAMHGIHRAGCNRRRPCRLNVKSQVLWTVAVVWHDGIEKSNPNEFAPH